MFTQFEGILVSMEESPHTRFQYTIWFDYTREAINKIQEGTMLAVANFGSDASTRRWSVLEVTAVMPSHFALQSGNSGYPGFVTEALRSAAEDWEKQDKEATEETTKIETVAIPTSLEIGESESNHEADPIIQPETNMAMVGSQVRVLDSNMTNQIANNGIDIENEKNLAVIGKLARDSKVAIHMRVDELLRTHFAIFGFTGVGKSNLLSTTVAKIFESSTEEKVKLVFFDLMGEYTGLLIDQLLSDNVNGRLLTIGRNSLPEGTFRYINEPNQRSKTEAAEVEAAKQLLRHTLLPKALQRKRNEIGKALRGLLRHRKVRYFNESQSTTVWDLFFTTRVVPWAKGRQRERHNHRLALVKTALRESSIGRNYKEEHFNPDTAKEIRQKLEKLLEDQQYAEFRRDGDLNNHISKLKELERSTAEILAASTTLPQIIDDLNDETHHSLWIVQSHNPNDLRNFSHNLGNELYESRRHNAIIDPLVSFIFDEADEFIRSERTGSYASSAEIAETIARRGRKFGIGLGIATQRIRYLDTNIMSQPHTYFISKLPRASDREAVAQAFGFGDEMLNQTFKFLKGQWLLVSHDATGLEAVPLPIKTPDANERIAKFLDDNVR